ncbi:MAG: acyltransferase family protein [Isosphaeraceae bacterium]
MSTATLNEAVPESANALRPVAAIDSSSGRLVSLDAYRGLIMSTLLCGAIFASLKGDPTWNWLYAQNEHVAWQGCVYWDLIQPSFMFMVGVAMPFALAKRAARGDSWARRFGHVLVRALGLIMIGVLLDNFGAEKWSIGFIRVLQQIAIGYVLAFFVVGKSYRTQGLLAAAILVGYTLLWMFNPWNGPKGPWAMSTQNIGAALDFWMLGRHYTGYYVGLNAIPSTATIIFGVMAGQLIHDRLPPGRTMLILLLAGLSGIGVGLAVSPWFPLIKRIWTPSFAVYAAGWTTLMLLFFYATIDVLGWKRWAFPLVVVGMNSIAAYVLGNSFGGWFRSLTGAWIGWLKQPMGAMWFPVFQHFVTFCCAWLVLYWLWRRRIFFKV